MSYLKDWRSTTAQQYPIGTIFTAGTATWTKVSDDNWVWEHPDQPDVHHPHNSFSVSRLIDQGRIWQVKK